MSKPPIKSNRAERREIDRAIKRADKRGNDCCGQPMSRLMPALVLRLPSGIKVWHTTCPTPPGAICIGVMSAECGNKNPDIEVDRIWFAAHPGAEFYWRKAQPEEWERWAVSRQYLALQNNLPLDGPLVDCPEEHRHMAVRQVEPGKRMRLPIVISPEFPPPTIEWMRETVLTVIRRHQCGANGSRPGGYRRHRRRQSIRRHPPRSHGYRRS